MWKYESSVKFYLGNLKEEGHMEDIDVDGRIILKLILEDGVEKVN
jgi:hypothetical protein